MIIERLCKNFRNTNSPLASAFVEICNAKIMWKVECKFQLLIVLQIGLPQFLEIIFIEMSNNRLPRPNSILLILIWYDICPHYVTSSWLIKFSLKTILLEFNIAFCRISTMGPKNTLTNGERLSAYFCAHFL